jgi:hypothetical protein
LARSADLFVDTIGDELLVYDVLSKRAHSLNNVSATVWKACDGTRTGADIAAHTGVDLAAVELALDNLADIELISGHRRTGISRRTALRRIGVGAAGLTVGAAAAGGIAAALPVIRSITAPNAAMALSQGATCTSQSCGKGSHCNQYGYCHSGSGHVVGDACEGTDSCLYGDHCNGSSKCATGQAGADSHPCTANSQCNYYLYCSGNGSCHSGKAPKKGDGCQSTSSCAYRSYCDSGMGFTCQPL